MNQINVLNNYLSSFECQNTVKGRKSFLTEFCEKYDFNIVNKDDVIAFMNTKKQQRNWSQNSFNTYYNYLKSFNKYLNNKEYSNNFFTPSRYKGQWVCPRVKTRLKVVLTHEEAEALLRNVSSKFQKLFIFTLLRTGLRKSEVLGLLKDDLYLNTNEIIIRTTKNKERRRIKVDAVLMDLLYKYSKGNKKYVFESRNGLKISSNYPNKFVKIACERAGISRNTDVCMGITPHIFRAGFVMDYYRQTKDIIGTQAAVGHNSVQSTRRYINAQELVDQNVIDNMHNDISVAFAY